MYDKQLGFFLFGLVMMTLFYALSPESKRQSPPPVQIWNEVDFQPLVIQGKIAVPILDEEPVENESS